MVPTVVSLVTWTQDVKPGQTDTMATPYTYSDDQLFMGPVEFI